MMTARMIRMTSIGGDVGIDPEDDDEDQQPDRAPEAEADAARARAHPDGGEHDHELQHDGDRHVTAPVGMRGAELTARTWG